jgi:hypothetical protein
MRVVWIIVGFACIWLVPFGAILNTLHHRELGMMVGGTGLAGILVCFTVVKATGSFGPKAAKPPGGGRSVTSRAGPRT